MLELEQIDVAAWRALALERVGLDASEVTAVSVISAFVIVLASLLFLPRAIARFRERPRRVSIAPLPQALPSWTPQKPHSQVTIQKAASNNIIMAYCPATGSHLEDIDADTKESINSKIARAQRAQLAWKGANWRRRRRVLRTIRAWIVKDIDTITRTACRDTGKTAVDAVLGEILTTLSKLNWLISDGEKVLKKEMRPNNILLAHKRCTVYHEPIGVIAALVSWNYPCHNALSPALASLTTGNAIIVKCSEIVAWSSRYFISGLQACLVACNESPDLVQLVACFPPVAPILTSHKHIKHITFIGSEVVAKHVARDAAKSLTPCCLELGGKDPMIILEDTNIDFFTQTWLRAAFGAAGQNCIGAERFIVSSKIMDAFLAAIEPRVKTLRQGSFLDEGGEVDIGAMISDNRFDSLERLIKDAVYHGARILIGGRRYHHPKYPSGHYFQPTLIVDVTPDMDIAKEEMFAPVFLVMKFDTIEDAIRIANSSRYGLGSSIFGANRRNCRYIADRLECGMVNINDFAVSYLNQGLPFGGVKASGNGGRFGGPEGLLSLTTTKAVTEDRFFSLIKTAIPGPVHYPHQNPAKAQAFVVGLASFFGGSWTQAIKGIAKLIKASM